MRHLIEKHWAAQRSRGHKPLPVYALVSHDGAKVKTWSAFKRSVEVRHKAEWSPENWKIEKINPPSQS